MGDGWSGDPGEARVAALEAQLEDLLGVVADQREQLDALERRLTPPAPTPAPTDAAAHTAVDRSMGRRRLLLGGATAAAATAAAVVTSASPAAAANNNPLVMGVTTNTATLTTKLTSSDGSGAPGLDVQHTGTGAAVTGSAANASGYGTVGVNTTGIGVYGQSTSAAGVGGLSSSGIGVLGTSTSAQGVYGASSTGTGVWGASTSSFGLVGIGDLAALALRPTTPSRTAPTGDTVFHTPGDIVIDGADVMWLCTVGGTPGTWRRIGGPDSAGAFHVLPAPARVYDSRFGTQPPVGSKTPLQANVPRVLDTTANSSGVPAGATAVLATLLLVNAFNGNGNLTIWANGVTKPLSNTIVWGTGSGRYTASAVSAVDATGNVQVQASVATDLVLDIVGYYR